MAGGRRSEPSSTVVNGEAIAVNEQAAANGNIARHHSRTRTMASSLSTDPPDYIRSCARCVSVVFIPSKTCRPISAKLAVTSKPGDDAIVFNATWAGVQQMICLTGSYQAEVYSINVVRHDGVGTIEPDLTRYRSCLTGSATQVAVTRPFQPCFGDAESAVE